jgi:hypothetical protein
MTQAKQKTEYTYKLFRVKNQDGWSTTVSVDPVLVAAAIKALGDNSAVARLIHEASLRYNKADANCSRSRFVQRQLLSHIQTTPRGMNFLIPCGSLDKSTAY